MLHPGIMGTRSSAASSMDDLQAVYSQGHRPALVPQGLAQARRGAGAHGAARPKQRRPASSRRASSTTARRLCYGRAQHLIPVHGNSPTRSPRGYRGLVPLLRQGDRMVEQGDGKAGRGRVRAMGQHAYAVFHARARRRTQADDPRRCPAWTQIKEDVCQPVRQRLHRRAA